MRRKVTIPLKLDPDDVADIDREARRIRKVTGENSSRNAVIRLAIDSYFGSPARKSTDVP